MKVRDAKAAELVAAQKADRKMTPRQIALAKRDEVIRAAFIGAKEKPKALDLEKGEKLPTVRIAVKRLMAEYPGMFVTAFSPTVILVSASKLPGKAWKVA